MARVIIINAVYPPEPVVSAKIGRDLAIHLAQDEWQVTVLCPRPSRPYGFSFNNNCYETDSRIKNIIMNSFICPQSKLIGRSRESYSFGMHCYKYIQNNFHSIDIIYANTWPLLAQLITVKAAKKLHIPIVIHVQDIYPESFTNKLNHFKKVMNSLLLPIDKYVLRNADRIIAISEKMKETLIGTRGISKDKIMVVQNWQDEKEFINYQESRTSKKRNNKPFTFMYMGNIGPVAGVEFLIESFFEANMNKTRLVIAGAGSNKRACERLASCLTKSRIEFWDVPSGKVPEIQDQADVMLLPIKKNAAISSIPSKLPAYMFSKKPIIACADQGSDTEFVVRRSGCGLIVEPENKKELVNCMKHTVSLKSETLRKYGENGYNYAMKNYSRKNINMIAILLNKLATLSKLQKTSS